MAAQPLGLDGLGSSWRNGRGLGLMLGFTRTEWLRAAVAAILAIAIGYPLLVFVLVAGQP